MSLMKESMFIMQCSLIVIYDVLSDEFCNVLSDTGDSFISCGYQFSWIEENLHLCGYLISCSHEIHENWYPRNNKELTVVCTYVCIALFCLYDACKCVTMEL